MRQQSYLFPTTRKFKIEQTVSEIEVSIQELKLQKSGNALEWAVQKAQAQEKEADKRTHTVRPVLLVVIPIFAHIAWWGRFCRRWINDR